MKKLSFVLVLLTIFSSGCYQMAMDAVTDNAIKIMREQERIDNERRQQSFVIEGKIKSVETRDKKGPAGQERKVEGKSITVKIIYKDVKFTYIIFEDGREKELATPPEKPLKLGTYYIFVYNGMNEVTTIKEISP